MMQTLLFRKDTFFCYILFLLQEPQLFQINCVYFKWRIYDQYWLKSNNIPVSRYANFEHHLNGFFAN